MARNRETTYDESDLYRPRSIELETEFIQQLIQTSSHMKTCYGLISVEDLSEDGPKEIYRTMIKLHEKLEKWNSKTLKAELRNREEYETFFEDLPPEIDTDVFTSLVKNVKITTIRRKLHSFLYKQYNTVWETDPQQVAAESLMFFADLDIKLSKKDTKNLRSVVKDHIELMKARYRGDTVGIPTGFGDLDFMLGQGLKRKEVIVPAARPGVGKTSFCASVALNAAKKGNKVLFITVEMEASSIMDKLLAFHTRVPLTQIIRGKADKKKLVEGYKHLRDLPLSVKWLPSPTSAEIYSIASKHKYTTGLDLLVVDYLGLIDKDSTQEDVAKLGKTMLNFKSMANMLNCSILVPHQLNRKIEHRSKDMKDPLLSDLRGSGQIEEHAAAVLFLIRETIGEASSRAKVRIAKNRYGETGVFELNFNTLTTRFEER